MHWYVYRSIYLYVTMIMQVSNHITPLNLAGMACFSRSTKPAWKQAYRINVHDRMMTSLSCSFSWLR